jgi:hypothetical protein
MYGGADSYSETSLTMAIRVIIVLILATTPLAAQSSSTLGVLPPDRAFWFLLAVNGVPTQDIDIDVHFTVSGPVEGRILDLDQYAKLEGTFESAGTASAGALDLSLTLPAREYGRLVGVELRHQAAGAASVDERRGLTRPDGYRKNRKRADGRFRDDLPVQPHGPV